MNTNDFLPVDLGHIQEKAIAAEKALKVYRDNERSPEMREKSLRSAENYISVLVRDIDYYMDTYTFNGERAMGLDEIAREIKKED